MIAKLALLILTGTVTAASLVAVRQSRLQAVAEMTAALKEAHADDLQTRRVRTEILHLTSLNRAWEMHASMGETMPVAVPRWDAPQHVLVLANGWPIHGRSRPISPGMD